MAQVEFDQETHTYKLDGKRIPSVTQIINELLPINYNPHHWYLQRGTAVHACAAFIAKGVDFEWDKRISGQVLAIRKFFREVRPEILGIEEMVYSEKYRYAGIFDLWCKIGTKNCLVDYKATMSVDRVGLQLAAYELAMKPYIKYGVGVEIREDGSYLMSEPIILDRYRREFLALRTTYAVRERLNLNQFREV